MLNFVAGGMVNHNHVEVGLLVPTPPAPGAVQDDALGAGLGQDFPADGHCGGVGVLAWLLDPGQSHSLGDFFLKRFLLETGAGSHEEIGPCQWSNTSVEREWRNVVDDEPGYLHIMVVNHAFENEEEEYIDDNKPLVTKDSAITVPELAKLTTQSFFSASDDGDADSNETLRENHKAASRKTALTLLSSKDDAVRATLEDVIRQHAIWEVPHGTVATIRIKDGESVEITLERTGEA